MYKVKKGIGLIGMIITWPIYIIARAFFWMVEHEFENWPGVLIIFADIYMIASSFLFHRDEMTKTWWINVIGLSFLGIVLFHIAAQIIIIIFSTILLPLYQIYLFFYQMRNNAIKKEYIKNFYKKQKEQEQSYNYEREKQKDKFYREQQNHNEERTNYNNTSNANTATQYPQEYIEAKAIFMLQENFTKDELKKQYHRLLKTFHPDEKDGNTEYTQKLNTAYSYLKQFAK